jgi:hypothetical protein
MDTDLYSVHIKEYMNRFEVTFINKQHPDEVHRYAFDTLAHAIRYIKFINTPLTKEEIKNVRK